MSDDVSDSDTICNVMSFVDRICLEWNNISDGDIICGILFDRVCETTKLTQELAVKLEQGRDLRQWHSMAN